MSKKKWKISKIRMTLFIILLIAYCYGLFWLKQHPEYTTYEPAKIFKNIDGSMYYLNEKCTPNPNFGAYAPPLNCEVSIVEVPPAYYIHQWLTKYRPVTFWSGIIILIWWIWYNWERLKYWIELLKKLNEETNDKKPNKRQRNS